MPETSVSACQGCGSGLVGRQRAWCSDECKQRHRPPRQGDRHRDRPPRKGDRHLGPRRKRFAGVDGESVNGRYTLLAWATDDGDTDDWIERPAGLSTRDCLMFLTEIPKEIRCWGFAFGYDVNMMLVDVPVATVTKLYETGACYWREFRIAYTPGKKLTVSRYQGQGESRTVIGSVTIWDMFTWIQTSFATWITSWELAPAPEIARIVDMKAQRSTFTDDQGAQIKAYCLSECRYLASGARRLVELIGAAGVNVSTYYSPATISKAMLKREGVTDHRREVPPEIDNAVDGAYMGGRAEVSMIGPVEGPLFQYDIRSAYPAMAISMPCLACGEWRHVYTNPGGDLSVLPSSQSMIEQKSSSGRPFVRDKGSHVWTHRKDITPWSLVRVSWRPRKGAPQPQWGPLPVRPRTGSLRWPTHGTGWFWGVEVLAAARHAQLDIKDVWTFQPGCDHQPFAYLADLYAERRRRKADGDPAEFVLKLALNATYGALAEHPHRAQKDPPKYRCLAWAGWITAATRAALLDVLTDDVILMATDCVLSRTELAVPLGDGLGDWEVKRYDRMFIAGTGIYYGHVLGEWTTTKTRGFESGVLTREMLTDLWDTDGRTGHVTMKRHRFIGMGTALHRIHGFYPPHARLWRKFIDEQVDKTLDVEPRRRWLTDDPYDGRSVAPTLATHRETAKADAARLARLEHRYDDLVATWERMQSKISTEVQVSRSDRVNRRRVRRRGLERATSELILEDMLLLANQITAAKREGSSIFAWSDDPMVG